MKNHSDVILSFSQFTANIQLFFLHNCQPFIKILCFYIFKYVLSYFADVRWLRWLISQIYF